MRLLLPSQKTTAIFIIDMECKRETQKNIFFEKVFHHHDSSFAGLYKNDIHLERMFLQMAWNNFNVSLKPTNTSITYFLKFSGPPRPSIVRRPSCSWDQMRTVVGQLAGVVHAWLSLEQRRQRRASEVSNRQTETSF